MSVSGVGIATVISNVISAGMMIRFLQQTDEVIRLDFKKLCIQKEELLFILKIGVPAGIQGMVFSIANVCIQTSINGFGASAVAGSAIAVNFEYISYYMVNGYNAAVMTFISQNYGAGNWKRCRQAYVLGMASAMITAIIMNSMFTLARNPLIGIFTSDPEVAGFAVQRMFNVVIFHFLICTYEITGSALRGLGKSFVPAILTVFGTCIFRIVYVNTYVVSHHTFRNLMLVYPVSWIVTGAMVIIAFGIVWHRMNTMYCKNS
jgi:Na+-driven multidrug efflux pump